jgi:amino-acid N-acetyltransferase
VTSASGDGRRRRTCSPRTWTPCWPCEPAPPEELAQALRAAADACRSGIRRVHLIPRDQDGALLRELFTRDGAGTLISDRPFEELRPARIDDIPGIRALLGPLEQAGVLVPRPREDLEQVIDRFSITERDGTVISCAALFCWPEERIGELACVAVHPEYRERGRGDRLLARMETLARERGLSGCSSSRPRPRTGSASAASSPPASTTCRRPAAPSTTSGAMAASTRCASAASIAAPATGIP